MKYIDQHHEISVDVEDSKKTPLSFENVNTDFHRRHRELYGYAEPDQAWVIVNLRVVCREKTTPPGLPPLETSGTPPSHAVREVLLDTAGRCALKVYNGNPLPRKIGGPALIELPYTTIYVPAGFKAQGRDRGWFTLHREEDADEI